MAKKTAKTNSYNEDDDDFLDAIEEALDEDDVDDVPDDEYEPDIPEPEEPKRTGRPMIVREVRPDTLTVVRKRVALTRSMCRRKGCNYDASKELGGVRKDGTPVYDGWKRVPPQRREECLELLSRHLVVAHSFQDDHIVFEDDMKNQWFGVDEHTGEARRAPVSYGKSRR